MTHELLSRIFVNQWLVLVIVTLILLVLAEAGYHLGLAASRRNPDAAKGQSGSIQGAVLGLLGLLLGFSFAMSVGRYDNRRSLVVEEANSIGTTWLRTDFLNSPAREEVRGLLQRYTRQRIEGFTADDHSPHMAASRKEVAEIHGALWSIISTQAKANPSPLSASLITSLNETIDLDSTRLAAARNHVPGVVWILLLVVAGCGSWASGHGSGTGGVRSSFSQLVFPLLIGVVITIIADIDRPDKGLIGVSQRPLQELLDSLQP